MTSNPTQKTKYHGRVGFLYPYDIRHDASDEDAFAFERCLGEERILVLINRGPDRARVEFPFDAGQPAILWGTGQVQASSSRLIVEPLPAWSGLVLQCSPDAEPTLRKRFVRGEGAAEQRR